MHDMFEEGIDLFNAANWYDAHEVWEDLWRETQGEARLFYQGLIQIAVGLHHIKNGNFRGGRRVLERGKAKLADYPPNYCGIDNQRLQQDLLGAASQAPLPPMRIRRLKPER